MVDVLWGRSIFEELRNFSYDGGSNRGSVYPEKTCRDAVGPWGLIWVDQEKGFFDFLCRGYNCQRIPVFWRDGFS